MTDVVTIAILASLPPTLVSIATLLQAFGNRNALADTHNELQENHQTLQEIHVSLNSRLSELLKATHSEGRQDERDSVRKDKCMTDANETHPQAPVSPLDELDRQQVHQHEVPKEESTLTLVDKALLSQVTEEDKEKAEEKADKHHKNKKKKKHL